MNNENYYHKIEMVKINENNGDFYNIKLPPEISNIFNLKVIIFFLKI